MTTKEQKFIRESFKDGFFRVFDRNDEAMAMHVLLDRYGVKHEYGDYLHEVEGKRRYNYGIRVLEVRKLQDLILSPADEDNPVKDMERLAGREPGDAQTDASENASRPANDDEREQTADPASAPKKTARKRKKVNL